MNLEDIQKRVHAISQDQGWYDTEPTFGDQIARIHSGLSRALEAYRAQGIFPSEAADSGLFGEVAEELADVVIRVAALAEHRGYDLSIADEYKPFDYFESNALTFGTRIAMLHGLVADAFRYEEAEGFLVQEALAMLIAGVQHMADHYGIDLDAAIEAKIEDYYTRSYRRGGKAL